MISRFLVLALALLLAPAGVAAQASSASRLLETIKAACPSVTDLNAVTEGVAASVKVEPSAQQACAQPVIDGFNWSAGAQATWENLKLRAAAKALFATIEREGKALRCYAEADLEQLNLVRAWIAAYKVEVAAATNLANLQSRVAALPNMPARTLVQVRNAIDACIDAGTQD